MSQPGGVAPGRSGPATSPPARPAPLIAPTGSPGLDVVADVVNATAAPFETAPPAAKGAPGAVSQVLGGVLGAVGAPAKIIDTAFAELTAPIAAMFPSMPAVTLLGMHVAPPHTHTHPPSLIPPAPPVPLPSLGMLVGSGAVTVMIGGMPAARAGDIGIAVTCGSLAPPFEVSTGSSNVFIGGARAARILDLTKHCNPTAEGPFAIAMGVAGVAAGAAGAMANNNIFAAAQAAADAATLAIKLLCGKDPGLPPGMGMLVGPPVPNVLIGGFPCPPIGQMAVGALLKALKAFASAFRSGSSESNGCCGNAGHPVNVVTGENFDRFVDFVSGGLFEWQRHYTTARAAQDGPHGHGWRHGYMRALTVRLHRATFTDWNGLRIAFPAFEFGSEKVKAEGRVLVRVGRGHYRLSARGQPTLEFVGNEFAGDLPLSRVFADGREVRFEYDDRRRLVGAVEQAEGSGERRRFHMIYDASGHLTRVVEATGAGPALLRAEYRYDGASNLVGARDAAGGSAAYEYDAFHRWTRQADARGYGYRHHYDARGRCVATAGDDGLWSTRIEYFPEQQFSRFTEGESATWEVHYDGDGVVTRTVDPYGGVAVRERDGEGRLFREVDSGGREMRWLYDGDGAHFAREDRFGNLFPPEIEMPRLSNPFARSLPRTSFGRLFDGHDPQRREAPFGADESLFRTLAPEALSQARLVFRTRPSGTAATTAPVENQVERDALGRKIRETDLFGRTRIWGYDAAGNLVATRDRDGRVTAREITSWKLVGERRSATGAAMRYGYSKIEQVTRVVDPLGNETRYEFDLKERLVRVHRAGLRDEYLYDSGDHLVEKRDGAGAAIFKNEIHENHFVKTRHLATGGVQTFDYDERGRVTEASTEAHQVRLAYDRWGRRRSDLRDDLGIVHHHGGGEAADYHERTSLVLDRFSLEAQVEEGCARLRDPVGRETTMTFQKDGMVRVERSNGTLEILQYGPDGELLARLVQRRDPIGRASSFCAAYTYSPEGDLVQRDDSLRGTTRFEVDEAHRLTAEISGDQRRELHHDAADNLRLAWSSIGAQNQLVESSAERFAHDARGRLASRTARDGSVVEYRYDSLDMLVAVERSGGGPAEAWTARYDAVGRRIGTRWGDRGREFFWDGDRLVAEELPDRRFRIYQYASDRALVPIAFVDFPSRDADPATGKTYQVFSDPAGLPLHIEDEQGRTVWFAERTRPFGQIDVRRDAGIEYNLRWPGHYFDPETGLHCNRYRAYDPALGRYLQPDPIGYRGSPVNLYAYCTNPLVHVDVLGLSGDHPVSPGSSDEAEPSGPSGKEDPPEPAPPEDTPPAQRPPLGDEEGQAAVDQIHAALPEKAQGQSVTTLTQLEDGRLVLTNSDGTRPAQREVARAVLGNDVLIPDEPNNPGYLRPADRPLADPASTSPTHGEARGIQAGDQYGSPAQTQWSQGAHGGLACDGCEASQTQRGIHNPTGNDPNN